MKNLLIKEFRLAASPLSYIFLAATLMTLLPGYPILVGTFFVCQGLFQSFLNAREADDMLYTVLLPIRKTDFVRSKYLFSCYIEICGFLLCSLLTALRMTLLSSSEVYITNPLMNATPVYIAFVLLIFASFNWLFIGGYFKNGYKLGIPFLKFGIACLLLIVVEEALPHFPGLAFLHAPAGEQIGFQFLLLGIAAVLYAGVTFLSYRNSCRHFENLDL